MRLDGHENGRGGERVNRSPWPQTLRTGWVSAQCDGASSVLKPGQRVRNRRLLSGSARRVVTGDRVAVRSPGDPDIRTCHYATRSAAIAWSSVEVHEPSAVDEAA